MPRSSLVPASSCASSTTAPAPSPNSTQVVRSFQSRMREKVSAADHQRALERAGAQQAVGGGERIDEARAHRLQVERRAMMDAEPGLHGHRGRGKGLVGRRGRQHDQVDRLRIDLGVRERGARGMQAQVARSVSPGAAMRRSWMPVRCTIHSSDVSTVCASSVLVRTRLGR